ncbi:MAG: sulfite exporter TauE/SafE family protein [Nanoarchaeota archaeon]
MITLLISVLALGFLLGMKHSFETDHIVSISTIVSNPRAIKKSAFIGILWGIGHTLTLFIVGLIVLAFRVAIPERIALSFELIVGIMLVILGINVVYKINKERIHIHFHKHYNLEHIHFHSHKAVQISNKIFSNHQHKHLPLKQALLIGIIHGLAGSASLSLLVLTTINSLWIGLVYLILFGIGSIIGMVIVSIALSLPFQLFTKRVNNSSILLQFCSGVLSIVIGFWVIYEVVAIF